MTAPAAEALHELQAFAAFDVIPIWLAHPACHQAQVHLPAGVRLTRRTGWTARPWQRLRTTHQ